MGNDSEVGERRANCIAHRKDTESNAEKIDNLEKTVYGNGTPGIKEKVARLEEKVDPTINGRMTIVETNFAAVGKGVGYAVGILGVLQLLVGAAVSIFMYFLSTGKPHP